MTAVAAPYRSASRTFADFLAEVGDVPADRIRWTPAPGTATEADLLYVNAHDSLCELVNGTLVEKPVGLTESFVATLLIEILWPFIRKHTLGIAVGPDAEFRMLHGNVRLPDISYTRRDRLPNPLPQVGGWCPDLCVEVLSPGNTRAEMAVKRREYFASGCQLVWEIDPRTRTAVAYTSADDAGTGVQTLDGGTVLPGFTLTLADLFAEFDAAMPPPA